MPLMTPMIDWCYPNNVALDRFEPPSSNVSPQKFYTIYTIIPLALNFNDLTNVASDKVDHHL